MLDLTLNLCDPEPEPFPARDPAHWQNLLLEGWKIESTSTFKDHVEISFALLLSKKQVKTAFEDFIGHPVIARLHHEDIMNDL